MRLIAVALFFSLLFTSFSPAHDLLLSDLYENPETYLVKKGLIEKPGIKREELARKISLWKTNILVLNKVRYLKEVETPNGFEYKFLLPYVLEIKSMEPELGASTPFVVHHFVRFTLRVEDERVEYAFYDIGDEYKAKEAQKEQDSKSKVKLKTHNYKFTKYFKRGVIKPKGYVNEFKIEELNRFKKAINRLVKNLENNITTD